MFKLFFIIIFFNIKLIEIFKSFSFSFFFSLLKHHSSLLLITQKMNRLTINRFNIINEFLIEIKNYDIIILLKPDVDDELTKIDIL